MMGIKMENHEITLKVSGYEDMVTFVLDGARGDGEKIFWPEAISVAYHTHWIGIPHFRKICLMDTNLIGNGRAALYCQPCGLRVILPEKGLSRGELIEYFAKWNPNPHTA